LGGCKDSPVESTIVDSYSIYGSSLLKSVLKLGWIPRTKTTNTLLTKLSGAQSQTPNKKL